jgi:glycosyltransferase involved in cell wall biosynthesis
MRNIGKENELSGPPRVSVVLIFLNADRFLDEAIRSVLDQTDERWELLLVDDGSTDESGKIARGYASRHPGVRYLEHEGHENRGISASRNLGLRHASGEYVALLDADDVYLANKLTRQVEILDGWPEASMVYGRSQYWYGWTGSPDDEKRDRVQGHGIPGDTLVPAPRLLTQFITGQAAVPCPSSVLIRREVARDVGLFEENFRGMYEDQAFFAKVCVEHSVFVSNECLDRYRQHPASICSTSERAGERLRWRRYFLSWLAGYLVERGESDPELWQALLRETWLAREIPGAGVRSRSLVRWLDKWRLRAESLLLPAGLRNHLWARRIPELAARTGPGHPSQGG